MRRSFLLIALVVMAGAAALVFWSFKSRSKPDEAIAPAEPVPTEPAAKIAATAPAMPQEQPLSPAPVAPVRPEPSAQTRQMIAALMQIKGPITPEQAAL